MIETHDGAGRLSRSLTWLATFAGFAGVTSFACLAFLSHINVMEPSEGYGLFRDYGIAFAVVSLVLTTALVLKAVTRKRSYSPLSGFSQEGLGFRILSFFLALIFAAGVAYDRWSVTDHSQNWQATTRLDNPPQFTKEVRALRRDGDNRVEPDQPATGMRTCGLSTLPKLYDSDKVAAALEAQGAQVTGRAPWRVDATYTSLWWGFKDDVTVRLEPGATDVRIARRHGLSDYGLNCARLQRLGQMLQRNDVSAVTSAPAPAPVQASPEAPKP